MPARSSSQIGSYWIELEILENTLLAFSPIVVIAERQTQTINESITAYSTAVGPSSDTRKRRSLAATNFITFPLSDVLLVHAIGWARNTNRE